MTLALCQVSWGFPGGSDGKESACKAEDLGSIPGWGRSPGGGNGNPLQYSCLENPMDRGTWWTMVHGVTESQTRLSVPTGRCLSSTLHIWPHVILISAPPINGSIQLFTEALSCIMRHAVLGSGVVEPTLQT